MKVNTDINADSFLYRVRQFLKDRWYVVVGILPFVFGFIGFYRQGCDFSEAAYEAIGLYLFNFDKPDDGSAVPFIIEFARWTAPVVTISGLVVILGNLINRFNNWVLYKWWSVLNLIKKLFKFGKPYVTIALYGNDDYESKVLISNLKKFNDTIIVKVLNMHKHIPRADLYILFSDDEDNFDFYQKHSKKLEKNCRLNSRKEKNRLLSRDIVKNDFSWKGIKIKDDESLKDDNKYIIVKTERYSIKDDISDYITLVNMQELGAFKFWPYRWQGTYFNKECHRCGLCEITSELIKTLYKKKLILKNLDSTFVKDHVDYLEIGSIFLNYLINIDRDYVSVLCEEIRKNSKKLKQSLRFWKLKKLFHIENNYIDEFSERISNKVIKNLEQTECITSDKSKTLSISIIGDNEMAEHLLFTGLQLNIFNRDQKFTYNLFGDWDSYLDKHENIVDKPHSPKLVPYSSNIIENKQVLKDSDVIIVCEEDNPKKIVDDLLLITKGIQIDLISTKQDLFLKYKSNECVNFYNYIDRISNFEDFVEDNLNIDNVLKAFKNKYGDTIDEEKWQSFIISWNNNGSLYRYNYICQEEFFEIFDKCSIDKKLRSELNLMRKSRFSDFYEYPESKLD